MNNLQKIFIARFIEVPIEFILPPMLPQYSYSLQRYYPSNKICIWHKQLQPKFTKLQSLISYGKNEVTSVESGKVPINHYTAEKFWMRNFH